MDILLFQLLIVSLLFASPECLQKCCTSGFWGFLVLFGFGFGLAWFGLDFFFRSSPDLSGQNSPKYCRKGVDEQ